MHRVLKPPDIGRLRRNITLLKQVESETAQRLLNILNFEYGAMEQAVKNHPATLALSRISEQVKPPAVILLLSQLNHDAEALLVAADKLSRRGFTVLHIEEGKLSPAVIKSVKFEFTCAEQRCKQVRTSGTLLTEFF